MFSSKNFVFLITIHIAVTSDPNLPDFLSHDRVVYNINHTQELFKKFTETFNKTYNDTEYIRRMDIFRVNLEEINSLNADNGSDVYGVTEFTDMEHEEFAKLSGDHWQQDNDTKPITVKIVSRSVPDNWDWRDKNAVTGIGNQGQCRSCFAFSAIGLVEGQYAIKNKKLLTLSTQQMIDCISNSCTDNAVFPHLAINKIQSKGGFMADSDYRYLGFVTMCRQDSSRVVAKVKSARRGTVYGEEHLKNLVYSYGPVTVGFLIGRGFPKYRKGVARVSNLQCNTKHVLNHSVLVVGYGTENGIDYWIIKNSHGTHWGENGYMKLQRGEDPNPCNMLDYVAIVDM